MSYKRHLEEYLKESLESRLENQKNRPGMEVWPDDDDAMWVLRHSDPSRDIICSTPEFSDSAFCGTGFH
ncbi:MAG: hypothetical protein HY912_04975 [Desulfomonile tiedjei]|uniref:Uncharacterized protein n=1 Tax=Desulfomonile tiedjei TaxID=2358 RepID=A0A9D6V460_9BACT|nr:hypothetical protein [Desulfomonile tiedjei]